MPSFWSELVSSADTPEDLAAALALIEEEEQRRRQIPPAATANSGAGPPKARWLVETLADVAAFFGLDVQTVKQWRMDRDPPMPGHNGAYPLDEIARWRLSRVKGAQRPDFYNLDKEEREIEVAMARLKLDKARGALVPKADVEQKIRAMFARLRTRLEVTPDELAKLLPTDKRDELLPQLRHRFRLLLQELSDFETHPAS